MKNNLENIIIKAVSNIINNSINDKKIYELKENHNKKIHFIPKRYRIFGGLLQSMNIQFGNFIEELMALIISNENKFKILEEYNGKKNNKFYLSDTNIKRIDDYIAKCQYEHTADLQKEFTLLQNEILNDKGNNYILEKTNIRRGKRFFDEFLSIKYDDLEKCLSNISENKKNIEIFDELYKKIMDM